MFNNLLPKLVPFMRYCGKRNGRARQATDDNMALAHCMLDNKGYKQILKICNTYCFSTATALH
jgi:hypothetical protein